MNLKQFEDTVNGYYRTGETRNFPFHITGGEVWFSLLVAEDGKIDKAGFTSGKGQKRRLIEALRATSRHERLLLGVWTGSQKTHLFVLDCEQAIQELGKVTL